MTMRTYESLPTAAARIGVSVKTIRRRIAEGVLPVYPVRPQPPPGSEGRRRPAPSLPAAHGVRVQLSGTSSGPTRVLDVLGQDVGDSSPARLLDQDGDLRVRW